MCLTSAQYAGIAAVMEGTPLFSQAWLAHGWLGSGASAALIFLDQL